MAAVRTHALVHLCGELARRRQHERTRRLRLGRTTRADVKLIEQRQRERGRLAGAGLRAGEKIAAFERDRNRGGLDRCGLRVAVFGERAQQRGREPE